MNLSNNTALSTAARVTAGAITARESVSAALQSCRALNEKINTFTFIAGEKALERAGEIDRRVAAGDKLPLAGVALAVKDDFMYSEMPASLGSAALDNFSPPFSAAAVERLVDAGAVVIGKTNLGAMGTGSTRQSSPGGAVLHPLNHELTVASAGAAALAAGQCLLSLDSESGGALRQGASQCGVFGLRPTLGRISRYGLHMACSSFGQIGLSGLAIGDIKAALDLISGFDARDATTAAYNDFAPHKGTVVNPDDMTIGLLSSNSVRLRPEEREAMEQAVEKFKEKGHRIVELEFDLFEAALRAYYVIAYAEASSNLSRFDGIRYGRAADASNLEELYSASRRLTLGEEARRRSIIGTYFLIGDNFELYYRRALKVWSMAREQFNLLFNRCSLLLMPVGAHLKEADSSGHDLPFIDLCEEDTFCVPASLSGLPSLSLPMGSFNGLPVGVQLVGPAFSEDLLFQAGSAVKQGLDTPPAGLF